MILCHTILYNANKNTQYGCFYSVSVVPVVGSISAVAPGIADCDAASPCNINSLRKSLCWDAILDFADTNANNAHNTKNIVANHAVIRVKKLPAAAPVNAPPNIDAADEPDIPLPSDFCNKIIPIIKTATIINKTNKNVNMRIILCFALILYSHSLKCKDFQQLFGGSDTGILFRRPTARGGMPHCRNPNIKHRLVRYTGGRQVFIHWQCTTVCLLHQFL